MSSATVRISDKSRKILKEIAEQEDKPMPEILDNLLEAERQRRFFAGINAGYQALQDDTDTWQIELAERELLDSTLMDGLDSQEAWNADGSAKANE